MNSRMIITALCLFAALTAGAQTYQKRLALVIGNASYQNGGTLKNPVNDARAMANSLQSMGFEVMRHENVSQTQMKQAINAFGQKLRGYEVGLFYYAGHGIQHSGTNYMIPVEAELQAAEQIEFDCVAADRILAYMDAASTKVNILILDACRDNPFERSWSRSSSGNGLAMMNAPSGTLIAYATAPGKVASDGDNANGLYTSILLRYMKDPNLNLEQVFKRVRTEVSEKSMGAQVPWETTSLTGGDFFLSPKIEEPVKQQPAESNYSSESRALPGGDDPNKALEYYSRAQEKYDKGLYKEAIADYSSSINLNPLDFQAYLWRGHCKYNLGYDNGVQDAKMLEESIPDYSKVIQLDPMNSEAYYYRANAKKLLDRYNEAIPDFTMSIRYDPKRTDAYYYRGLTYYLLEKYAAASEDFTTMISKSPETASYYYWRGASLYALEEYQKSLDDFNKAIELDATYLEAYYFKADALYSLADYENARQFYEYYVKAKPDATSAMLFIGHCYYNVSSYETALRKYDEVLKADARYADAHYWKAHLYFYGLQQKDKAQGELKKALALQPDNEKYIALQDEMK